jgi:hypothetical protein
VLLYHHHTDLRVVDKYQMGFLEEYVDELPVLYGTWLDVGVAVGRGEDDVLVVEEVEDGMWYLLYIVDCEGFWEVVDEFFVEKAGVVGATMVEELDNE